MAAFCNRRKNAHAAIILGYYHSKSDFVVDAVKSAAKPNGHEYRITLFANYVLCFCETHVFLAAPKAHPAHTHIFGMSQFLLAFFLIFFFFCTTAAIIDAFSGDSSNTRKVFFCKIVKISLSTNYIRCPFTIGTRRKKSTTQFRSGIIGHILHSWMFLDIRHFLFFILVCFFSPFQLCPKLKREYRQNRHCLRTYATKKKFKRKKSTRTKKRKIAEWNQLN